VIVYEEEKEEDMAVLGEEIMVNGKGQVTAEEVGIMAMEDQEVGEAVGEVVTAVKAAGGEKTDKNQVGITVLGVTFTE
jgi:inorganic pyrophosphatase